MLHVLGVPEHFNRPLALVAERWAVSQDAAAATDAPIARQQRTNASVAPIVFTPVPGGTGAMVASVLNGEAPLAVALTEGVIAAATRHPELAYAGEYVTAPLRWMVATGASRDDVPSLSALHALPVLRVSVSRLGSGSHLMAHVLAATHAIDASKLEFHVHKDFRSMRRAVVDGAADVFMWEWAMTRPFVTGGELRALGFVDTPWHAFGFVARRDWLDVPEHRELLHRCVAAVLRECAWMKRSDSENAACEDLAAHYGLSLDDAHEWLQNVSYASELRCPVGMLADTLRTLHVLGIVHTHTHTHTHTQGTVDTTQQEATTTEHVDYRAWAASLCHAETAPLMTREEEAASAAAAAAQRRGRRAPTHPGLSTDAHEVGSAAGTLHDRGARANADQRAADTDIFTPVGALSKATAGLGGAHEASRRARALSSGAENDDGTVLATMQDVSAPVWYVRQTASAAAPAADVPRTSALDAVLAHLHMYGGAQTQMREAPGIPAAAASSLLRHARPSDVTGSSTSVRVATGLAGEVRRTELAAVPSAASNHASTRALTAGSSSTPYNRMFTTARGALWDGLTFDLG